MDEEIKNRFASLEKEIADLKKIVDEDNRVVMRYIERHGEDHNELSRKVWASYGRTHPEVMDTLIQCDKILGTDAPTKGSR